LPEVPFGSVEILLPIVGGEEALVSPVERLVLGNDLLEQRDRLVGSTLAFQHPGAVVLVHERMRPDTLNVQRLEN